MAFQDQTLNIREHLSFAFSIWTHETHCLKQYAEFWACCWQMPKSRSAKLLARWLASLSSAYTRLSRLALLNGSTHRPQYFADYQEHFTPMVGHQGLVKFCDATQPLSSVIAQSRSHIWQGYLSCCYLLWVACRSCERALKVYLAHRWFLSWSSWCTFLHISHRSTWLWWRSRTFHHLWQKHYPMASWTPSSASFASHQVTKLQSYPQIYCWSLRLSVLKIAKCPYLSFSLSQPVSRPKSYSAPGQ